MKAITKAEHSKLADEVLKELLEEFFFGKDLEWSFREGVSIASHAEELYAKIILLYPEMVKSK